MSKPLVIVESPAKARTLERFLGKNYVVMASVGHIRDLPQSAKEIPAGIKDKPWARFGVDLEGDFTPHYVIPDDKKKNVQNLKAALKDASEVLLATDPDREGESISWHLSEVLKPRVPVRRIEFHEITEEAVNEALAHARDINQSLVRAQESRRIVDRLYGYSLSPVLWKKVQSGLSAGRVQSVAVRLIVEREEARRAFRTSTFWDLEATLTGEGKEFPATLVRLGEARVAIGKDFDSATGALKTRGVRHLDEPAARALATALERNLPWTVTSVEARPGLERPAPPFTTSTLTQEASRKLGYSTGRTMQIAQRLFQGVEIGNGEIEGLITYHRTDSTTLGDRALTESARVIGDMFGAEYHDGPRRYQTKVKNAQEAHEAIRPTDFRQTPQKLASLLESDELRLYDLIWKRTMASQMRDARVLKTTVEITASQTVIEAGFQPRDGEPGEAALFTASGKAIEFAGFRRAYVEGSDDPQAELEDQETILPACAVGDRVYAQGVMPAGREGLALLGLDAKRHETLPPARYTEAALIKELEAAGIGRPSTYASIIQTIQNRGYVFRLGKALVPSFTAFAVTELLRMHFTDYVDVGFTAEMEEVLDAISNGEREWLDFVRAFYRGDDRHVGLEALIEQKQSEIDYPAIDVGVDPGTGQAIRVRIGRYGPFLQRGEGGEGNTASLPDDLPPADLTVEHAVQLVEAKALGPQDLGADPATGLHVYVIVGRFGAFVQLGETEKGSKEKPRRASLVAGMSEKSITLDQALQLLSLPRDLGTHPDGGKTIVAGQGRFGPYVKHGDEFRSLEDTDDVFTIDLGRALELLAAPKKSRGRKTTARTVLKEVGAHPRSGAMITLLAGRYGPYVTDGTTNASLPKSQSPEQVTLEQAVELLAAREGAPKKGRAVKRAAGGARKTTRRKTVGAAS
ncbi:MAG: type I DNA topoisomerase [Vicinamibacteria bacterium]|nr:type I DNA topoisomerase [Vicinamibacteria bacterium]